MLGNELTGNIKMAKKPSGKKSSKKTTTVSKPETVVPKKGKY